MSFYLLALTACIIFALRKLIVRNIKIFFWSLKIPGPLAFPVIGTAYRFFCPREEIYTKLKEIFEENPYPIAKIWLGPKLLVIINDADYLMKILQSPKILEKDSLLSVAQPFVGQGLINGSGPTWKAHRKLIMPIFGIKAIENYHAIFEREAKILTNKLIKDLEEKNGKELEVIMEDYLHPCGIDIVCDSIMNYRLNAQVSTNHDFMEATIIMYYILIERMVKPWLFPDILFKLSSLSSVQDKTVRVLRTFIRNGIEAKENREQAAIVRRVVKSKVKRNKDEPVSDSDSDEGQEETSDDGQGRLTLLDHLIESKRNGVDITEDEIIDEMLTIFMASSDTMALIVSFCVKMMALHPNYQDLVVEEIKEVLAEFGDNLNTAACAKLALLERCIKETIRLFPIAPYTVRYNREKFQLDENTYIPEGLTVLMSLFMIHRSPKHWSNPDEFHPDHFLPENVAKRHQYVYLPFSSGLRSCIGKVYAIQSIKIIMVRLLQKLKFECRPGEPKVKDIKLTSDISVRAIGGNRVIVKKR